MTWDGLSAAGSNSLAAYNDGPNTLLHELFHHLGLRHTFAPVPDDTTSGAGCVDGDYGEKALLPSHAQKLFVPWGEGLPGLRTRRRPARFVVATRPLQPCAHHLPPGRPCEGNFAE
jgi:hypothetical protein